MISLTKNSHKNQDVSSTAFVLINCFDGKIGPTIQELEKISEVTEVQQTNGPYDIVATLRSESTTDLKNALTQQLKEIKTVRSTLTLRSSENLGML